MRLHLATLAAVLCAPVLLTAQGSLGTYEDRILNLCRLRGSLFKLRACSCVDVGAVVGGIALALGLACTKRRCHWHTASRR